MAAKEISTLTVLETKKLITETLLDLFKQIGYPLQDNERRELYSKYNDDYITQLLDDRNLSRDDFDELFLKKEQQLQDSKNNKIDTAIMVFNQDFLTMAHNFYDIQPYYFDKNGIWWLWNFEERKWDMIDEIDLINKLKSNASQHLKITEGSTFAQIIKSLKMEGRKNKPEDAPARWIQFKDKAFSLRSGKIYDVTHNYFFTNPIPHKLGEIIDTPIMDKLFEDWVGKEHVQTLYEIIAYCCYREYPIQTLFCFAGGGRNGKSCFLKVLANFLGNSNICSTELDLLVGRNKNRFESFKLYKRLACVLGETNFGVLETSALLKKLTGGDLIGFEAKNKMPFDDFNYAKLIIATNSLPSTEDTSDGFFRRWTIIQFPNEFPEGKDITLTIPDIEYNNLALKITKLLPKILKEGKITNQQSIEERKKKYIELSNPLPLFIDDNCIKDHNKFVIAKELYIQYIACLTRKKQRKVSWKEFRYSLENEGFYIEKTSKIVGLDDWGKSIYKNGIFIEGLAMKKVCASCASCANICTQSYAYEKQVQTKAQLAQLAQTNLKEGEIEEIDVSIGNEPPPINISTGTESINKSYRYVKLINISNANVKLSKIEPTWHKCVLCSSTTKPHQWKDSVGKVYCDECISITDELVEEEVK